MPSALHKNRFSRNRFVPVLALLAAVLSPADQAQAQVTYFESPPSATALRAALLGERSIIGNRGAGAAPTAGNSRVGSANGMARPSGTRVRGLVWADTGNATTGPAAGMPIGFHSGSSRLDGQSAPFLATVAEMLASDPSLQLLIEGHTNSLGRYERNMVLSWDRAMGVYRTLIESYGIDPSRLQPLGVGSNEPLPDTAPDDRSNRRVQFRLRG